MKAIKYSLLFIAVFCADRLYAQQYALDDTSGSAYAEKLGASYTAKNELFLDELKKATTERSLWRYYEAKYKAIFKALNEEIKDGLFLIVFIQGDEKKHQVTIENEKVDAINSIISVIESLTPIKEKFIILLNKPGRSE